MDSTIIATEGSHIDFQSYVENFLLPQIKTFEMTKVSVSNAVGDKATITRNKHGFYKIKYQYVKDMGMK